MSKNDAAWEALFDEYHILREIEKNGLFTISAKQIKKYREPRLMTKFDRSADLPQLFQENGLAILPVTRGSYAISHFNAYHPFECYVEHVKRLSFPSHIESVRSDDITSETVALNCAAASGIIADFVKRDYLIPRLTPTVSGRMGSGTFDFYIHDMETDRKRRIHVQDAQIEIDAAYETYNFLILVEAKIAPKGDFPSDFLIRQLYYPFRGWQARLKKKVRPVFLIYQDGHYILREYEFQDVEDYNSLKLVNHGMYAFRQE